MKKDSFDIKAECKTVTPMMASGANQQEFEIRASEVKGALRFWWRAFQPESGKELAVKEAELFGTTEGACPFQLRVQFQLDNDKMWNTGDSVGWPKEYPGLPYFLYPVYEGEKKPKYENRVLIKPGHTARIKLAKDKGRPVAQPEQTFQISIKFKPFTEKIKKEKIKDVLLALWLLENLGGIGGRTRRGAGCFEITSLLVCGESIGELRNRQEWKCLPQFSIDDRRKPPDVFLKEGLDAIISIWKCKDKKTTPKPDYTTFCQGLSEVHVVWDNNPSAKAIDVMSRVSAAMQKRRKKDPLDEAMAMHESMANAISNTRHKAPCLCETKSNTITKAALGMPIIYNFHEDPSDDKSRMLKFFDGQRWKTATFTAMGGQKKGNTIEAGSERRASPLLISCHEREKIAYAVFCHFPAPLLPREEKLYLKANFMTDRISELYEVPDHSFARMVIDAIGKEFNHKPVITSPGTVTSSTTTPSSQTSAGVTAIEIITKAPGELTVSPTTFLPSLPASVKVEPPAFAPKTPEAILRDIPEGYILARLRVSPEIKEKICPCVRLLLNKDETLAEETGWTVKTPDIRLEKIEKGDLFMGKLNPQNPKRLNDLKKIQR